VVLVLLLKAMEVPEALVLKPLALALVLVLVLAQVSESASYV
jgi:hypothetical protein